MKTLGKICVLILFVFSFSNCQKKVMEEKSYEWSATVCGPQEYPAEVYSGALIADGYEFTFDSIWGIQNTGWGNNGGNMVSEEKNALPHTLHFTYLSIVENKFYTGEWSLDKDLISKLFSNGFNDNTGKKGIYTQFKIGLAPGGKVALWVSGAGNQKEVGFFQAKDTIIEKDKAYENARYMFKENYKDFVFEKTDYIKPATKVRLEEYGFPEMNIYDNYRKKYNWKLTFDGNLSDGIVLLCNGESNSINETMIHSEKALPFYLSFAFNRDAQNKKSADLIFTKNKNYFEDHVSQGDVPLPEDYDKIDIHTAFKEIDPKQPSEIIISETPGSEALNVTIKQHDKSYHLRDAVSRIF